MQRTGQRVLTSPSSPGLSEVTARSLPLSSKALMLMPQLVWGCLNQFCSTCLKSILCQWPTLELSSIFSERMRMWRLPCSVTGLRRRICRYTVEVCCSGRRYTHSWAFSTLVNMSFGLNLKKQQLGLPFTCTRGSAVERRTRTCYCAQQSSKIQRFLTCGVTWQ